MPGTDILEKTHETDTVIKAKRPNQYKVIMLNDDITSVQFVIAVLVEVFYKTIDAACKLTAEIDKTGSGIAGVYSLEEAEMKTSAALDLAKNMVFH